MRGSITDEQMEFVEQWESVSPQTNWIVKIDRRGDEVHEAVRGHRTFRVTSYERILNQDRVVDPANDPFRNGCFRPLLVPESVNIETNPNALADDDIERIFKSSDVAWEEYMKVIDAAATLDRMISMAEKSEYLSVKRLREIEAKHAEATKGRKKRVKQKDSESYEKIA